MNKKFNVLMIAFMAIAISFTSCGKDEDVAKTLSATPPAQTVSKDAGSMTITVAGNTDWTASSSASWCTVAPAAGSGNGSIVVNYSANSTSSSRTASVSVIGTGVSPVTAMITQDAGKTEGGGEETATTGTVKVKCDYHDGLGSLGVSQWYVTVSLLTESGTKLMSESTTTGSVTFSDVLPGTYTIEAEGWIKDDDDWQIYIIEVKQIGTQVTAGKTNSIDLKIYDIDD